MEPAVVVVTGGGKGIGKGIVERFLDSGRTVVAVDRDEEALLHCGADYPAQRFLPVVCDVTRPDQVQEAVARAEARFGRVDVLVNNAGGSLGVAQPLECIEDDDWDRVVQLNLKSVFLWTKAVLPGMKRRRFGRIVNVASMAGRGRSVLGGAPYAAAKAGIIGLTRHISMDLGQYAITVNAVAPGTVLSGERVERLWNTRKTAQERQAYLDANPMGRLGTPEDVAGAVLFLSGEDAGYITGAVLDVNGGTWVG